MIPEKFSIAALKSLIDVLRSYSNHSIEFVKPVFERETHDFEAIIQGAWDLEILLLEEGFLVPKSRLDELLQNAKNSLIPMAQITNLVLESVFSAKGSIANQLKALVDRFEFIDGQFQWKPRIAEISQFVGLRNVLLESGVIDFNSIKGSYVLNDAFIDQLIGYDQIRRLTPDQLLALERAKLDIGTQTELAVVQFEKALLRDHEHLIARVSHVSLEDVSAGYDVLSFEKPTSEDHEVKEKYIEVKAVSLVDWKFHWTRREIEKARMSGNRYYLYLVPIVSKGMPSILDMRIIKNPFEEVLKNSRSWDRECESFQVWPKNDRQVLK